MISIPKYKIMVLMLLAAFSILMLGCSMDNKQKNDFKEEASDVLETLELCIENFGFPEDARLELEDFFETTHQENTREIKKRIASVYMAFIGKTNFRDKNDTKNKDLFIGLLGEIGEIKVLIEKYEENK